MHYTIYKTTNLINSKIYIGKHQTLDLNDGYLGSGKLLKRAIEKHGIENFKKEILFVFDNESDMNAKEAELITSDFLLSEDTYNLCVGGQGGFSFINNNKMNTTEFHRNFAVELSKRNKENGVHKTPEFRKKMSEAQKISYKNGRVSTKGFLGKEHTEEWKKEHSDKMKILQSSDRNSQFGTMWITDGVSNRKIKKDLDTIPKGWYKGRVTNMRV